jgi:ubiquitin-protein ligase
MPPTKKQKCAALSASPPTLQSFCKAAMKDNGSNGIQVEIEESDMAKWNVVFSSKMFDEEQRFCVRGDGDTWIPLTDKNAIATLDTAFHEACEEGDRAKKECYYVINGQLYFTTITITPSRYNITQKNMDTFKERRIKMRSLSKDMDDWFKQTNLRKPAGVYMEVTMPPSFPTEPPFVRVLYPRFQQMTGHVTIGGSICAKVLTTQPPSEGGWDNKISPIGLFLQIKQNMIEGNAQIDFTNLTEYDASEAREAYKRALRTHGW